MHEDRINDMASTPVVSRVSFYVVLWDKPGEPVLNAQKKTHVEIFRRGAFSHSVLHSDVTATINDEVVASKCSGNLRLTEDETGLLAELIVPPGRAASEILAAKKSSITFALNTRKGDAWSKDNTVRVLTDIDLLSVGLVI
jgi:phage head maturation protease